MAKYLSLILSLCLFPAIGLADTTRTLDWSLIAEHRYHRHFSDNDRVFRPEHSAVYQRSRWTDYPFIHGATYAKLIAHIEPIQGLFLEGELVAEHRGISYGVYPKREMIVFPRVQFGLDTSIPFLGDRLSASIRVGHFNDLRLQEGLTVFNIDVQGADVTLGYKSLFVRLSNIGDLEYSYGLRINDLHITMVGLRDVDVAEGWKWGADLSVIGASIDPAEWIASSSVNNEGLSVYGAVGRRPDHRYFQDNWATLGGVKYETKDSDFSLLTRAEYRFYSAGYNFMRYSGEIRYRHTIGEPSSTMGDFLYPLDRFDRPYVAWALYTKYTSSDIESASGYVNGKVRLVGDFWAVGMGELVFIRTNHYRRAMFPFFETSIAWEPVKGWSGSIGLGNRAMNLDEHFPTLYALKVPTAVIKLRVEY